MSIGYFLQPSGTQMYIRDFFLAVVAVALSSASPSMAQEPALARTRLPVVVVVPDAYPAFEPQATRPGAVPLRAVVMLRDPAHGDSSVVLLNPAHADPHTLYEALSVLRRLSVSAGTSATPRYVVLGSTPGVRRPAGAVASRLESFLSQLKTAASERVRGHRTRGRSARLHNVWEFFPQS
jgi:hypothetical protein